MCAKPSLTDGKPHLDETRSSRCGKPSTYDGKPHLDADWDLRQPLIHGGVLARRCGSTKPSTMLHEFVALCMYLIAEGGVMRSDSALIPAESARTGGSFQSRRLEGVVGRWRDAGTAR